MQISTSSSRPHMLTQRISRSCQNTLTPWYIRDIWSEIMSFLNGKSLLKLALVNRSFYELVMDENVWKCLCFRELRVPATYQTTFSWRSLYIAAFDGSHSFSLRQRDKHIDWMRIGAFSIASGQAIATVALSELRLLSGTKGQCNDICSSSFCVSSDVKKGSWIADLHLVRCPVCNVTSCEGTMQVLDARHWDLFLYDEYKTGDWDYHEVGAHVLPHHCDAAAGGVFDAGYLEKKETLDLLELKSWVAPAGDWQPRGKSSSFAIAANTNLQPNEGLQVKFYVMLAGANGPVVGIRICQQLL
ncbi:hypothetical protein O6H91_09G001800 [Diphasiastrum complanatum]|uniref:Uncharacterized protein n=2 Tax=Diphasiastrum complanatum TaxID=34168 RepID=A0ACC2CLI5_DIPCM|nr:hypothetical protein O6H91_09G001800 [Diphasiastrum complanatum]KAJ7542582.1 hypothetical protein O6H91_09G001800 [Diphasiastrum complanatum]